MIVRDGIAIGVLMLAAAPAAAQSPPGPPDWSHAEVVSVELSNFKFTPDKITLKAGQAYDLRLQNRASGGHDFAAQEFFAAAKVMDADRAKVSGGKIALDAGQSVDVHFVTPHAGTYKLRCTHFMHSSFGMTGEIVVQ
ncbi:cupredoxin-like protein [Novosphingobium sp. PhB165]|uniref:cupredoxin domain-containing protein n=1 Tax=Novosphingobium sp. PhB165 TaxID=2485105 RepID=UPI00104355BE|nr:cupredoxin domain-containing protein [Novosphingobium sp. PhB165]TCM16424.1 cupredoxin-like protein [Novosphingobium sp. PhB165]